MEQNSKAGWRTRIGQALLMSGLLGWPLPAPAQEIDVENDRFPGARRVKVQAYARGPAGFWAVYELDAQGRAVACQRYRNRRHLTTERYTFYSRGKLQQETITHFRPGSRELFRYTYHYSPDSARILRKVCRTADDTLYVQHYLAFDADNRPTRFTHASGWSRPADVEVSYAAAGQPSRSHETSYGQQGEVTATETDQYQYNAQGDLSRHHRATTPPPVGGWFDGQGDTLEYAYDYSPRGPWTRRYQYFDGEKVLIEKRTFTW